MITAQLPADEQARLFTLEQYGIMDTRPDKDFDEIVNLASIICNTPISLITLLDEKRQWFKAKHGIDGSETTRDTAFCAHAILQNDLMIVPNALEDERFHDNPFVTGDPDVRFYAGMPLVTPGGYKMGTLCVIDKKPRKLDEQQLYSLQVLGRQVVKQMELHKRNQELKKRNELDRKLLSIIGHDLRTPFSSMQEVLYFMDAYNLPVEKFKEMIPLMRQSVTSGLDLVSNLVEWGASQFQGNAYNKEACELYNITDKIITTNQQVFAAKNNAVVNLISGNASVFAHGKKVEFVLRNLLLNANKFTNDGSITVSSSIANGQVIISVQDSGQGIAENLIEGLFSWEKKTSTSGTHGEKGSGLGLPMCKEFVEMEGGSIWAESQAGKGSVFHVALPVLLGKPGRIAEEMLEN